MDSVRVSCHGEFVRRCRLQRGAGPICRGFPNRMTLSNLAFTLLFCVPFVTMRALAGERQAGTLEGLLATGVDRFALVVGKWMAGSVLCGIALASTGLHASVLLRYGEPDLGILVANYVGLFLCCIVFVAGGLVASAASSEPISAGVGGVLLLLPLWLAGAAQGPVTRWLSPVLDVITLESRLRGFGVGTIDAGHVLWFVALTLVLLVWAWAALEVRRWR